MNVRSVSIVAGLLSAFAVSPSAFAVSGCTNSNLSGSYAMPFSGAAAAPQSSVAGIAVAPATGAAAGPWRVAGIARLSFDGAGTISGYSSATLGGAWAQSPWVGTYNVTPDCAFTFALNDANGGTSNYTGVLTADGAGAVVLQTDAGTGFSGSLFAIRNSCQTSDLSGGYGVQYSGSTTAGASYSSVGSVSLDGQGGLAGAESRVSGASVVQAQSAGSIAIAADCSITLSTTSTNGSLNFFGFPSADGKRLAIVQSDAGTAASGTAVAQ